MTERLLILVAAAGIGALALLAFIWYRARFPPGPDRLEVDELGLELMSGCCAFVVFTTPSCRPCKAALKVVDQAAVRTNGMTEVRAVDAMERPELAVRYEVRTIPTVFLITASGHVVRRWRDVPDARDVDDALALV
ncbi:MAG: thioredoxin domain-containing protein [Actinomycetota bacterium]